MYEKKRICMHRIVWLCMLILGIVIPLLPATISTIFTSQKEAEIVSDSGYINDYYEYLDKTSCDIEVVCNENVDYAYITVAFYDANGSFLAEETGYFYGYGKTISHTFYIYGEVDSYEITDYDIQLEVYSFVDYIDEYYFIFFLFMYLDTIPLCFFIASWLLSYKEYEYNGNTIIVYAGFYHHYISVNGIKFDEHNTLISYTPIYLSCTLDSEKFDVTISLTNRISLKVNNVLYAEKIV